MNIRITEYTREDKLQALYSFDKKQWIVRRTDGICRFYQSAFACWVPAHMLMESNCNPDFDIRTCLLSLEQALNLLGTLPPIK